MVTSCLFCCQCLDSLFTVGVHTGKLDLGVLKCVWWLGVVVVCGGCVWWLCVVVVCGGCAWWLGVVVVCGGCV